MYIPVTVGSLGCIQSNLDKALKPSAAATPCKRQLFLPPDISCEDFQSAKLRGLAVPRLVEFPIQYRKHAHVLWNLTITIYVLIIIIKLMMITTNSCRSDLIDLKQCLCHLASKALISITGGWHPEENVVYWQTYEARFAIQFTELTLWLLWVAHSGLVITLERELDSFCLCCHPLLPHSEPSKGQGIVKALRNKLKQC